MATNTFTSGWVTVRLTCTETVKASSNSSTLAISMECANTGSIIRPGTYNTLFPDGTIKVNGTLLTNGDDGCATKTFNSGAGSHVCDLPDSRDYAPVKSSKQQTQSVWKITVPHEADGTGTARITVNITVVPPSAYYSTETITGTWNLALTPISAQPSTFTISGNLWLGQTLTANITKAKDTDSNTLFWRLESEGAGDYRPIGSATTNSVIFWDTSAEPDKTTLADAVSNGFVTVRFRLQTTSASTATYSQPVTLAATAPKASTISSVTSGAKIGETVNVTITPSDASYSHELAWRLRTPKTSPYTPITTIAPGASSVSWNTADNADALTAALADGSVDVVLKLTTTGLPEGVTPNYDSETVTLLEAKSTEASEFVSVSADRSIGQTVTVKFRTNDRSYSHKLEWRGESESTSSYRTIGTQAAQDKDTQSFSWNTSDAANALYGLCPKTTTAEIVLRLTTVELSKYSYYHMTLSVPADAAPTLVINSIRPEPAFTGTSVVGLYLSGISQVCATVTTTLASGATVEKYTLRVGDKITDLTSTATHPTIYSDTLSTTGADQTVEVTVTDSRGFSTKATLSSVQTINVLEYAPPKLSAVSVYRSNSSGGKDSAGGAYIAARATLTVSPVTVGGIDCNSASGFRVLTKEKGSGSYVSRGAMTSGTRKVFRDSVNGSAVDYSTQSAYEVKIEYTDTVQAALGADPRYLVKLVPSAVIPFHLADDGTGFTGAAIGEAASAGYFSVGAGLTFYPKGPVKGADWTAADTNKATLRSLFEVPTLVNLTVATVSGQAYSDIAVTGLTTSSRVIVQRRMGTSATAIPNGIYPVGCVALAGSLRVFWNATPSSAANVSVVAYIVY